MDTATQQGEAAQPQFGPRNPRCTRPMFSVIVPTRDRTLLFERALLSILAQKQVELEVIVVDDGSDDAAASACRALALQHPSVRWFSLPRRTKGHGPSFSRNTGAALAQGRYLCFLDDDDQWVDQAHLRRCMDSVAAQGTPVDMYLSDQQAVFADGRVHPGPLWLCGVHAKASSAADAHGSRRVSTVELLQAPSFAHLNCTIMRRSLFESLGGFDESLRYEEDRDLYLRALDAAGLVLYNPAVIGRHHIPDRHRSDNASTSASEIEKRIQQLRICDKLITTAQHPGLRALGRQAKGHTLKRLAEALWTAGRNRPALIYMDEALALAFSFKWLAYVALRRVQASFTTHRP